jgi:hypothetical protein
MNSNVQNSEKEKSAANEHTIDNQTYDELPKGI